MFDRSLFISDLHIDHSRTDITAGFFSFLDRNKHTCDALYILGDLFEVWIGDDAITAPDIEIASKLREFSECGASVFVMHGNRDFLLGSEYADLCGATIIHDHHLIKIGQDLGLYPVKLLNFELFKDLLILTELFRFISISLL